MPTLSQLRKRDASSTQVLVIVCAGVVLASIDLFVVNVALPDIARDLHQPNLGDLSWVLNGYAIVYASLLVVFGRLAEGRSRDAGFLLGVLIFTLASAACGLASSLAMLVGFRIVQAAGAALLTPTSLSLVLATTNPERRHGAVRGWTAVGGAAAALGPVARRPARRRGLALGVLRQRPDRAGGARDRVAAASPCPRSSGAGARRARRGADHRRRRCAHARPGRGQRLGLGLDAGPRCARRRGDHARPASSRARCAITTR